MAKKAIDILKIDVKKLITLLNKALADEWLAYYQYWIGSKVVKGQSSQDVIAELVQHATDELRHADMLAARIIQLDGTPILNPSEWAKNANCKYAEPKKPFVKDILKQNIAGEQCAIEVYQNILEIVKDKDFVTYDLVLQILKDEIEHEQDLSSLLEDITIKN